MKTYLLNNLKAYKNQGLYRTTNNSLTFVTRGGNDAAVQSINTKKWLSFSSNDYLGLASHPEVVQACKKGLEQYGVGSGAAQLLGGYSYAHHALEEELAAFLGYERVLLFSTGYMANLGVITSLFNKRRDKHIFVDRLSHASIIDGGCSVGTNFKRYQHLDTQHLERILAKTNSKYKLISSEGVFGMDGDLAPLSKLSAIARENNSWLMIDDAHGIGFLGEQGRGSLSYHNLLIEDVQILVGTFGKAFGTFGAFVAGSDIIIESLIQFARTYIYTTALSPAIVQATRASLKLLQDENWRREHLVSLIKKFKQGAQQLNLPLLPSITPIQSIIIGNVACASAVALRLKQLGILVALVRPPTVPINTSRLRISLNANHTEKEIDYLLDMVSKVIAEKGGESEY